MLSIIIIVVCVISKAQIQMDCHYSFILGWDFLCCSMCLHGTKEHRNVIVITYYQIMVIFSYFSQQSTLLGH